MLRLNGNSRQIGTKFLDYHPYEPVTKRKGSHKQHLDDAAKLMQMLQDEQKKNDAQKNEISRLNKKIASKIKYQAELKSQIAQLKAEISQKVHCTKKPNESKYTDIEHHLLQTNSNQSDFSSQNSKVNKATQTEQHSMPPTEQHSNESRISSQNSDSNTVCTIAPQKNSPIAGKVLLLL